MFGLDNLLIGRTLADRYRIEEVIGRGRTGPLCRAVDVRLDHAVAVKVVAAAATKDEERKRFRERFHCEAAVAAKVHHPNVVGVYGSGTDAALDLDFLVMELLRGEDLAARLTQRGRPPAALALRILQEAAQGIAAGHREGFVHRDVCPANLFLTRSEDGKQSRVRVLAPEFAHLALARAATAVPGALSAYGTAYSSPEQLRGDHDLTPASDVFSLGATGYELLTGASPLSESVLAAVAQGRPFSIPMPRDVNPDVPSELSDVLVRALNPDPAVRFPDAAAFLAALGGVASAVPAPRPAPAAPAPAPVAAIPAVEAPKPADAAPAPAAVEPAVAAAPAPPAVEPAPAPPVVEAAAAVAAAAVAAAAAPAMAAPIAVASAPEVAPAPAPPVEVAPASVAPVAEVAPAAAVAAPPVVEAAPPAAAPAVPASPVVEVAAAAPSPVQAPPAAAPPVVVPTAGPPSPPARPAAAPARPVRRPGVDDDLAAAMYIPEPVRRVVPAEPAPAAAAPAVPAAAAPAAKPVVAAPAPVPVAAPVAPPVAAAPPAPPTPPAPPVQTPPVQPVAAAPAPPAVPLPMAHGPEEKVDLRETRAAPVPPKPAVPAPPVEVPAAAAGELSAPPSMRAARRMKMGDGGAAGGKTRVMIMAAAAVLVVSGGVAWAVMRGPEANAAGTAAAVAPAAFTAGTTALGPQAAPGVAADEPVAAPAPVDTVGKTPEEVREEERRRAQRDSIRRVQIRQRDSIQRVQQQAAQLLAAQQQAAAAQQVAAALPGRPVETAAAPPVTTRSVTPPAPAPVREEPASDASTFSLADVQTRPRLSNMSELNRLVQRHYPALLRENGVTGRATAKFVVNEDGRVDRSTIQILDASRDAFGSATVRVIQNARFSPAQAGGRPVKVWVTLPIDWTIQGN